MNIDFPDYPIIKPKNQLEMMYNRAIKAEATADRRLELLKEMLEMEPCPFCWGWKEHSESCKLGKELHDAALGK